MFLEKKLCLGTEFWKIVFVLKNKQNMFDLVNKKTCLKDVFFLFQLIKYFLQVTLYYKFINIFKYTVHLNLKNYLILKFLYKLINY